MKLDIEILSNKDAVNVTIRNQDGEFVPSYRTIEIRVHGLADSQEVLINGSIARDKRRITLVK